MTSALFGILQLDRGEPLGYSHIPGLVQSFFEDAGGFAMAGLIVYLLYALATPTDKSQSEKIRVPVSMWMLTCAGMALVCYAGVIAMMWMGKGLPPELPPPPPGSPIIVPPPAIQKESVPLLMTIAGAFALLGIGEPVARDLAKLLSRNFSLRFSGVQRFGRSVATYTTEILNPRRLAILGAVIGAYVILGIVLYALDNPRLFGIYEGVCIVALTVLLLAFLTMMLFQAEGPIWAIAKLSFKEAVRSQLLWVFLIIFLPSLFPAQWFRTIKPVDELRLTVSDLGTALTILVLFPAVLLASFGLPTDIKNLNIYTVVSKPVERFEIVLGRFVGYVALMTLVLIGLTGVSLVLIMNTNISQRAKDETYKARVPVRGKLEFKSVPAQYRSEKIEFEGRSVGREFDYRKYINGHPTTPHRAIWNFTDIPSDLINPKDDVVPVEFTFDIFKMTKGEQNKGVEVSFRFTTQAARQRQPLPQEVTIEGWPWEDAKRQEEYKNTVKKLSEGGRLTKEEAEQFKKYGVEIKTDERGGLEMAPVNVERARPHTHDWEVVNKLAEEFGFYETKLPSVLDYTVTGLEIPAGLFRNAMKNDPGKDKNGNPLPRFSVYVKCESPGQMLGMAEPDLYLLEYEQPFELNYVKGMVGVWCWLCIIVGIAVACSTYLSGVLVLIITVGIFLVALLLPDHINDVANGRSLGGGPFESMSRTIKAEQPTAPTGDNATAKVLTTLDKGVAWMFRRVKNLFPDLESSYWSEFVAEGFNIKSEWLVVNLLMTFGYLLPWAILARYAMKMREVAA